MEELLRLESVNLRFGQLRALIDVNLTLHKGEVLGLVGDNGAGKSTVSKVISGAVKPDSGSIFLRGRQIVYQSPRDARESGIEMVYQDLALCDDLDVSRNLFMGREKTKFGFLDRRKMHRDADRHLRDLGVRLPSTALKVRNLSGGQRQAVAIARAVTFQPDLLILDEPTAALAVKEVNMVLELIRTLAKRGVGIILITHRLQDLFLVCDRLNVMYEGSVLYDVNAKSTSLTELVGYITNTPHEAGAL